jgi:2-polyprenyl-6-methoxyphenol hydroxylase-like FAD-dependent oxidoreductase
MSFDAQPETPRATGEHIGSPATTAKTRRALIVGAGIASPVLGLFLRRAGVEAMIFGGQPGPPDEAGAFLNLAPNGRAVLDALGIGRDVDAASTPMASIEFVNHQGKRLGRNPDELLLIKRGALNRVLRERAIVHGVGVEFAKRLVGVSDDGGRVTARFADGSEATGDVLVGCDGVHSVTRQAILPDGPRRPTPVWSARAASSARWTPARPGHGDDLRLAGLLRLPADAVGRDLLVPEHPPAHRTSTGREQ